jgi:TPR repeat protein
MPRKTSGWAILALALCSSNARADVDEAKAASRAGNFARAYAEFREAAELGHPEAQFNLGVLYFKGLGVEPSPAHAFAWIQIAAENGLNGVDGQLAIIRTKASQADIETVTRELRAQFGPAALSQRMWPVTSALRSDTDFSGSAIREVMKDFPPIPADPFLLQTSRGILGSIRDLTDVRASILLIDLLVAPDGSVREATRILSAPKDYFTLRWHDTVGKLRLPPLEAGSPRIARRVQLMLTQGGMLIESDRSQTLKRVAKEIVPCAQEGSPACQYYAALLPLPDETLAGQSDALLLRAAQGGFAQAQFVIGHRLSYGRHSDLAKARVWLEAALGNRLVLAAVRLARLEIESGTGQGWGRARSLLEDAYEAGETSAALPLAALYAAAPEESMRNADGVAALVKRAIRVRGHSPYTAEIEAAAAAARGDFDQAVRHQNRAIDLARERNWNPTPLADRLASYERRERWFGDLLAF